VIGNGDDEPSVVAAAADEKNGKIIFLEMIIGRKKNKNNMKR
jgi:hypothetical protein